MKPSSWWVRSAMFAGMWLAATQPVLAQQRGSVVINTDSLSSAVADLSARLTLAEAALAGLIARFDSIALPPVVVAPPVAPPTAPPAVPPSPPSPPPPATGGAYFSADFSAAQTDAQLQAMIDVVTQGNIHADQGVGMRYDFQPRPTRCAGQSLVSLVKLPRQTRDVWISFRAKFSAGWSNANANCTARSDPQPDYKWVLGWLDAPPAGGGTRRFDLKAGTSNSYWSIFGPGWASKQSAPIGVLQPGRGGQSPFPMSRLWDGKWHDVEIHWGLLSGDRYITQVRIDGVIIGNVLTGMKRPIGLDARSLDRINIGANRNLGATTLTHLWWDDMTVWVSDPGWSPFPAPRVF